MTHPTHPSSTPITAEGAVKILRDALDQIENGSLNIAENAKMRGDRYDAGYANAMAICARQALTATELFAPQDEKAECSGCDPAEGFCRVCREAESQSAPIEAGELPPDSKVPCWSCNYYYTRAELMANDEVCPRCAATIPTSSSVASATGIYEIQRNAAESAIGDELANLGLIDPPTTLPDMALLAGIQALCISADQEWCRQGGELSASDIGWFTGQLHIFDMYTAVDKSAIAEAREYIKKLALTGPATSAPSRREKELDAAVSEEIGKRDLYHDWADKLAEAIAKHFNAEIGEHSSANCPWAEALEVIEAATKPASTAPASGSIADDAEFQHRMADIISALDEDLQNGTDAAYDRARSKFVSYIDARQSVAAPEAVQGKASDAEARYEFVRKLHPVDFATLYSRNLAGEGSFDALVDAARAQQQTFTPQKFVPGMNDIGGEE